MSRWGNRQGAYLEIAYNHDRVPELRIGQFWSNFFQWVQKESGRDPFYMEDNDLLMYIHRFCDSMLKGE